jgi:hypothetical protein
MDMAIVSRIKSLVRYDYQSYGILLHPYYKSEIVARYCEIASETELLRILDVRKVGKLHQR